MKNHKLILGLLISFSFLILTSLNAQKNAKEVEVETASGKKIKTKELDKFIESQMKSNNVPGLSFALINKGKMVYNQSYGIQNTETGAAVDDETIFEAASVSKSVFAYFTLKMVEKGFLDLDTPLYKYLPEEIVENDDRYKLITTRMALSHTTGLPNWRFFNEDGRLDIKFTPGTKFSYSGEGYEYLAKALASIFKTDYAGLEEIIREEVYEPLTMTNSGFMLKEEVLKSKKANGYEDGKFSDGIPEDLAKPYFGASFKFHTNAIDFSNFMINLIKEEGMKPETFDEMFSEQVVLPEDEPLRVEDGFESWSLGFIRAKTPYGLKLVHGGMNPSFQCYFMIIKEKKFGFVFFGNSNTAIEMVPAIEQYLLSGKD
ncbi:MAG: serine hydrolase domain-containing protein [Thermonemataceae bacterium]